MSEYLTEVIGTFFLVLTIGLTAVSGTPLAPLAIGTTLMALVYMGGHVSGAHYNPAISVAFLIRGVFPARQLLPYVAAQLAGATLAALTVEIVTGSTFAPAPGPGVGAGAALLVEVLFTFSLALVILNVASSKHTEGNQYYGLAIGVTIIGAAFAGGGISGGAYNPAVGFGPTLVHATMGGGSWAPLWLHVVGPMVGAVLAAFAFRIQEPPTA